jgi:integrase
LLYLHRYAKFTPSTAQKRKRAKMAKTTKGSLALRGGTYYARWVHAGKVFTKSTGTTSRREAEKRLRELVAPFAGVGEVEALERAVARLEGRRAEVEKLMEVENPPLPVAQSWGAFLADPTRPDSGERTLCDYYALWMRFSNWMEGRREGGALRDVTEVDAAAYAADLAAAVGPSTFNKHIALIRLIFRTLRKTAKLTCEPFEGIRRKRYSVESRREMTIEELRRVCQSARSELRTLLAVGLYSGLRLGDAVTLSWGEVDLIKKTITRVPNKTARRNGKAVKIPIHPELAHILEETPESARRGLVHPDLAAKHDRDTSAVSKAVSKHLRANGIDTLRKVAGRKKNAVAVGYHSLRHSFVSLCREAGAPLSVVESIVGHASPAMTQHYSHTSERAAQDAVALLPGVMTTPEPEDRHTALATALRALVTTHGFESVKKTLATLSKEPTK